MNKEGKAGLNLSVSKAQCVVENRPRNFMVGIKTDKTETYVGQKYLGPELGLLFEAAAKPIRYFGRLYRTSCRSSCLFPDRTLVHSQ